MTRLRKQRKNMTSKWTGKLRVVAILSMLLTAACATSETSPTPTINTSPLNPSDMVAVYAGPKIPFNAEEAFFPLHPSGTGVFYSWDECTRRIIACLKWEYREIIFRFDDPPTMGWFINNDFGFKKREKP